MYIIFFEKYFQLHSMSTFRFFMTGSISVLIESSASRGTSTIFSISRLE